MQIVSISIIKMNTIYHKYLNNELKGTFIKQNDQKILKYIYQLKFFSQYSSKV